MAHHVYDYVVTEEDKAFLAANFKESIEKWNKNPYYPPDLRGNSHQMVINSDGEKYYPHAQCVGGIDYTHVKEGLKFTGGYYRPNTNLVKDKEKELYNTFLDWCLSAGPGSAVFVENSAEEMHANGGYLTFHGEMPGNVIGMAMISTRMYNGANRLRDWAKYIEAGVSPWVALWLCHSAVREGKKGFKQGASRGCDNITFATSIPLAAYNKGIINNPSPYFSQYAKMAFNGSLHMWGGSEGTQLSGYKFETTSKVPSNNIFLMDSSTNNVIYGLTEKNVGILNHGLCPRVKAKQDKWLKKGLLK